LESSGIDLIKASF